MRLILHGILCKFILSLSNDSVHPQKGGFNTVSSYQHIKGINPISLKLRATQIYLGGTVKTKQTRTTPRQAADG